MLASVKLVKIHSTMGITTNPMKKIRLGSMKQYPEMVSRRTSARLMAEFDCLDKMNTSLLFMAWVEGNTLVR